MTTEKCPICEAIVLRYQFIDTTEYFDCPICGKLILPLGAKSHIDVAIHNDTLSRRKVSDKEKNIRRAILKHHILKITSSNEEKYHPITLQLINSILNDNPKLPTPVEQINNLILFIGNSINTIDETVEESNVEKLLSLIGCSDDNNLSKILNIAKEENFINFSSWEAYYLSLTLKGWNYYEDLKKTSLHSNMAFLALQFKSDYITEALRQAIKEAVAETGFKLEMITDNQQAGSIDNNLRLKIKNSRFVIADMSDHNNGAYWEAGYAEGLGKTVIYICNQDQFEKIEKKHKEKDTQTVQEQEEFTRTGVHFDTNHHLHLIYSADDKSSNNIKSFLAKLKDTIRISIPDAKQEN
jgi:nucleoside 2-deoxyribosyltransferase